MVRVVSCMRRTATMPTDVYVAGDQDGVHRKRTADACGEGGVPSEGPSSKRAAHVAVESVRREIRDIYRAYDSLVYGVRLDPAHASECFRVVLQAAHGAWEWRGC